MAAGGFREFVAGETLDEDAINDFLMQGMLVFAGTAARGSAIGTPVEGQFSFLADSDSVEFYDGSQWVPLGASTLSVEYVVIGGGASGGGFQGNGGSGGGGAGGYLAGTATLNPGTYTLTVGAGGVAVTATEGLMGFPSQFGQFACIGGGGGGGRNFTRGYLGGSGGGGPKGGTAGVGISNQGFAGGAGDANFGGGGGGAGEVGNTDGQSHGGDGSASSITGSSVTRAGGGGGGRSSGTATGGTGGGGNGGVGSVANGSAGNANTGGGGGGGHDTGQNQCTGGNGGSGVVLFSVPAGTPVVFSGGVTESSATTGGKDVYTVTAAGVTDTVTIG